MEIREFKANAARLKQLYNQFLFKGRKAVFRKPAHTYPEKLYRELDKKGIVCFRSLFDLLECEELIRLSGYSSVNAMHDELARTNDIYGHFNITKESIDFFDSRLKLKNINVMSMALDYLSVGVGQGYYQYEECFHARGCPAGSEPQLQPHHDTKLNRIKIYLWLTPIDYQPHPLYYMVGDHRRIKTWFDYSGTRFPDVKKNQMIELLPQVGDLLMFDTHGIHSHIKTVTGPRLAFLRSIDPLATSSIKEINGRIRR